MYRFIIDKMIDKAGCVYLDDIFAKVYNAMICGVHVSLYSVCLRLVCLRLVWRLTGFIRGLQLKEWMRSLLLKQLCWSCLHRRSLCLGYLCRRYFTLYWRCLYWGYLYLECFYYRCLYWGYWYQKCLNWEYFCHKCLCQRC